jgi:hypothetical protein
MENSGIVFSKIDFGEPLSTSMVAIHELLAWELDEYLYRRSETDLSDGQFSEKIKRAKQKLTERGGYEPNRVLLDEEAERIRHLLAVQTQREDLRNEYDGLEWEAGVIDLRHLLAFQRRLVFDPKLKLSQVPTQADWPGLLALSFGPARSTDYKMTFCEGDGRSAVFNLQSDNPDLQLRPVLGTQVPVSSPFSLYGGCPFFEVAEFRGRWFLRDGYHRAYHLLRAGIYHLPAVVIRARTIDEVGATQPWFFSEEQLFSSHPPHVVDFLDDDLILRYRRLRFKKTIQISIEETLQPIDDTNEV